MHITLVTLGVADLDASTTFYEALGWRRSTQSVDGSVAFLVGGGPTLGLFGWEALAHDANVPAEQERPAFRGSSLAVNLPDRASVDDFVARAAAEGAKVTKAPELVFWGGYSGYFQDLDGHLWEVAHNPFWTLDEHGAAQLPT